MFSFSFTLTSCTFLMGCLEMWCIICVSLSAYNQKRHFTKLAISFSSVDKDDAQLREDGPRPQEFVLQIQQKADSPPLLTLCGNEANSFVDQS